MSLSIRIFLLVFFASCAVGAEITVSAAASLKEALEAVVKTYAAKAPAVTVTFNFGGSGALAQQIEHGAPVDVFFSAATKQMDALESKGLLASGTRRELLTNKLALVTPKDSTAVQSFDDLAKPAIKRIAIGDPKSVPAGMYAAQAFATFKLGEKVEPKLVRMLDVRQVLLTVASGNADAGIVYATDVQVRENVRLATLAPAGVHSAITYPVAAVKASRAPEAARAFVEFLASAPAREGFERFGFGVAP